MKVRAEDNRNRTEKRTHKAALGAVLTLLGGICWGLSGSMGQYLFNVQGMDTRWLVPIRLGAAGVILLLYSTIRYGWKTYRIWTGGRGRNAAELVLYGLCGVSFCQFLYFLTIQLSSAGVGTILQDLSPIFILAFVCITAHRLPHAREVIAIVLALAGVLLITTHGDFGALAGSGSTGTAVSPQALLTGVLSAVCVMIYNVVPERLLQHYSVLILQAWAFLMGGAFFALVFRPWTYAYVPNAMGLFGIAFVVIVGNILAFPLYIQGVKLIGPEKGILFGFSEPVTAAVIGAALLGNAFTAWDLLGFLLIFGMLVLIR